MLEEKKEAHYHKITTNAVSSYLIFLYLPRGKLLTLYGIGQTLIYTSAVTNSDIFLHSPLFSPFRTLIFPSYAKVWPKKWEFLLTSWRPVKITIPLLWLWVGKLELTMLFWQRAFSSVCNYTAYAIKFFL